MQMRSVGKWSVMLLVLWAAGSAAVSCGGGAGAEGSSGLSPDGSLADGKGGSSSGDDGAGGEASSSSSGTSSGSGSGTDSGSSSGGCITCGGPDGGDGGCVPRTTCPAGQTCGKASDGCGGTIDCGTCPGGQTCMGIPATCHAGSSDATTCMPLTACPATDAGVQMNCGYWADGCGGLLTCGPAADAGGCPYPQFCGGGGPNVCGGKSGAGPDGGPTNNCVPLTQCTGGQDCGYQGDGCGGVLTCGACTSPQYCGGGGFNTCGGNNGLGQDGAPLCTPLTCQQLGFDCGPAGDGCGGLLQCGTCQAPFICGGGGLPGVCGNTACTGLCQQQVACDGGTTTTLTGTVYAGTEALFGTPDPVPNVLVYVPDTAIQPFSPGVTCSQCGAEVSGAPLTQTTTAFDGTFTLTNVPAGNDIPVVIQLGRWRREVIVPSVPACQTTALPGLPNPTLRMPRTQLEGDIPLTAMSTGSADALECVLLKMGVDQSEFTTPSNGGRVQMYEGNGASLTGGTPAESTLMGSGGSFAAYDQILLPCWGSEVGKNGTELGNLVTYANEGGHFFATHYSYTWLYTNSPFNTVATWDVNWSAVNGYYTGTVQLPPVNPEGTVFSEWLHLVGACPSCRSGSSYGVGIYYPRHDVDSVQGASVDWISTTDTTRSPNKPWLMHFTFDTPVGATTQCGHAIFSDFHVANASTSSSTIFPSECTNNGACTPSNPCPMTPQEKILEYMIWDLASCVPGPSTPPTCTPIGCQQQNIDCGPAGDGCGNEIMCGTCVAPQTCGGGGVPGQCGAPADAGCAAQTCQDQNINCGPAGDGCGNEIMCGGCPTGQVCGGCGVPGQCCTPEGGTCTPLTCSDQKIFCGPAGDGCGNEIMCGTCNPPDTCGGGGIPGQCGSPDASICPPTSCMQQGIYCGQAQDGCGNVLDCGTCPTNYQCISGKCVPNQ